MSSVVKSSLAAAETVFVSDAGEVGDGLSILLCKTTSQQVQSEALLFLIHQREQRNVNAVDGRARSSTDAGVLITARLAAAHARTHTESAQRDGQRRITRHFLFEICVMRPFFGV
jgi:hypothetical protein